MTEEPATRAPHAPCAPQTPAPAAGEGAAGPDASAGRTALRRDPREVVGIYLSDSLANIATARRVLADHGLTDLALDNLLGTARIALESARTTAEELTGHA